MSWWRLQMLKWGMFGLCKLSSQRTLQMSRQRGSIAVSQEVVETIKVQNTCILLLISKWTHTEVNHLPKRNNFVEINCRSISKHQQGQHYGDQHYQLPAVVVTLVASTMMLDDTQQQKQKERRKSLIPAITADSLSSHPLLVWKRKDAIRKGKYIQSPPRSLSLNSLFLICNYCGRPKIISVNSV